MAVTGALSCLHCTQPELQEANITNFLNLPLQNAVALQQGKYGLTDVAVDGIRQAAYRFTNPDGLPGPVHVATVYVNKDAPPIQCLPFLVEACARIDLLQYGDPLELIPGYSYAGSQEFAAPVVVPLLPVVTPPAVSQIEGTVFEGLAQMFGTSSFTLTVRFDAGDPANVTTTSGGLTGAAFAKAGLYFHGDLSFDGGTNLYFNCSCPGGGDSPNPLPFDGCPRICDIQDQIAEKQGITDVCDTIEGQIRVNRMRLSMGFQPRSPAPSGTSGLWTKKLFPGAKDFHLGDMFQLPFVAGGSDEYYEWDDDFEAAAGDAGHDIALALNVEQCTEGCVLVDCENIFANAFGRVLSLELPRRIGAALAAQLGPRFDYQLPTVPPACEATVPPCNGPNCCTEMDIDRLIRASMTYQKWDWFAGAFGPYPNGNWLPIDEVQHFAWFNAETDAEPATTRAVFVFDADPDMDGIPTPVDDCPENWDPGQADDDQDGIGDACDPCKGDAENDFDHDGLCAPDDNCPHAPNPGQENTNRVSEQVHSPDEIWGDHCDPVPTPRAFVVEKDELLSLPMTVACGGPVRDELELRPLRSHSATDPGITLPVANVAASARYCQPKSDAGYLCDEAEDVQDSLLVANDCAPPAAPGCASPEDHFSRFHRITYTLTSPDGPDPDDDLDVAVYQPNDPPPRLSHEFLASEKTPTAARSEYGLVWDFRADVQRWVATSLMPDLLTSTGGVVPAGDTIGTDLQGTFWLHSHTPVGGSLDYCLAGLCTGQHEEQLANEHFLGFRVRERLCRRLAVAKEIQSPFFIWRTLPDPPSDAFHRWEAAEGEAEVIARVGAEFVALGSAGRAEVVTERLGAALRGRLDDPSLVWANAVEPYSHQGVGTSFPLAVALTANGEDIVDSVHSDGASLLADLDRGAGRSPFTGSPDAFDFVPVLTRFRGGVFVVGGELPATGEATGEVWFAPLDASRWSRVRTDVKPAHVLAATYSFASDSLYVLDETRDGEARLWSWAVGAASTELYASFPRHREWDRHALVVERDGAVLLASSSTGLDAHAIARIEATGERAGEVTAVARGARVLLAPPVVHGAGYTLLRPGRGGFPDEAVLGLKSVWLRPASRVTGDVAVRDAASGPCLVDAVEAVVGAGAGVVGSLRADDVRLLPGSVVSGSVAYNGLTGSGTVTADRSSPLSLPLGLEIPDLPAFDPGPTAVVVPPGQTRELAAGRYGAVRLKSGSGTAPARLVLLGGTYDFAELELGDRTELQCALACELRVAGRLLGGASSYLGPAPGAPIAAADVVVFVRGKNGPSGALAATPKAASLGAHSTVRARIFAPNGTLWLRAGSDASGSFVAREVRVGAGAHVEKDESSVVLTRTRNLHFVPATTAELAGQL